MRYSIIMPYYGRRDLLQSRMYEFVRYFPVNDLEYIFINDNPEDTDYSIFTWFRNNCPSPFTVINNSENKGFGGSNNIGAKKAQGEILVFISTDVVIQENIFEKLDQITEWFPYLYGNRLIEFPTGWNEIYRNGQRYVIPYLEGWFIVCHKDIWNRLGGFDEIYYPYDYEDIDLSINAKYLEIKLKELGYDLIHKSGQSIRSAHGDVRRREVTNQNRKKFEEKWIELLGFIFDEE